MTDDKVIDKLRKLLALTQSPNENEAASAAAFLQKFLTQHNLSIADLEKRGKAAPGMREQLHDLGKAAFKWKLDLADGIAEFYYCAPLVDRKSKTVQFIGRPENVEALTMLYGWVIDQIKAIATTERRVYYDNTGEHIDPLRWQLGFGEGAVVRLIERLRELKARQQEDLSRNEMGDVTALAIHHQAEVSDYLEEKFGYRTDGKKTKREQKNDERWEAYLAERQKAQEEQDALRIRCEEADNMAPYYTAYPDEHPDRVKEREERVRKANLEYERRERRNVKRRKDSYREGPSVDWDKEEQSHTARVSGKQSADRVNLQPFIGGNVDRKQVG